MKLKRINNGKEEEKRMGYKVARGCSGCIYWQSIYEDLRACHYMLVTGHRRPCRAGRDCKVRIEAKDADDILRLSVMLLSRGI